VKKLTYLELMEQGKVHVGSNAITSYRFTELGYLLAWIIESFNIKQREIANNKYTKFCNEIPATINHPMMSLVRSSTGNIRKEECLMNYLQVFCET
jgi:hypothetical protein